MRSSKKRVKRPLAVFVLLLLVTSALGTAQQNGAPAEAQRPVLAGPDPCSCARELTGCLLRATIELNQCLFRSPGPLGDAICLLRYEVQVGQCFQDVSICVAGCIA